jgi:protein-S-isoprenylcysteine O-methyltransferase Ste14
MSVGRQVRAIALLPGTVTIVVPALLLDDPSVEWGLPMVLGAALIVVGFGLWLWTVILLARLGKGTLAPWGGDHRVAHVAVRAAHDQALLGEAALLRSSALLVWSGVFVVINHAFFLLYEEPVLADRCGDDYREYQRTVPRWLPRLRASR